MIEEKRRNPSEVGEWIELQDPVLPVTVSCTRDREIVAAGQAVVRNESPVAYGD